jgi:hypothetical protein
MDRKWRLGVAAIATFAILACNLVQPGAAPPADVPTSSAPNLNAATLPPPATVPAPVEGMAFSFPGGGFVIPTGLATGATSESIPAVAADESAPWWDTAPAHIKVTLQGYALQGRFHEPQIVIYPAVEYAAANESVARNLEQLIAQLADPSAPISEDAWPQVPFFNAGPLIGAKSEVIHFRGGQGLRLITEYAQFFAPINNNDLFYHFQGLTDDGSMYIVAILPVTAPLLATDAGPASLPPAGGVPFPGYETIDEALLEIYYRSATDLLNGTAPDLFQPSLSSLDALIQSLEVSP